MSTRSASTSRALPAVTVVERGTAEDAAALLERALHRLDPATLLRGAALANGRAALLVAAGPTGPDPRLVDRLRAALESLVGEVHGVGGDRTPADAPEGSVLRDVELPTTWSPDALRVLVTTAATDPVDAFSGACSALLTLLPADCAVLPAEAATALLAHLPPHLVVVDAVVASDGCFGSVRRGTSRPGTVVVGTSAVAADEALAALMGVDPADSPLVGLATAELAVPVPRRLHGDVRPWPGWRPVPRELVGACQRAAQVVPGFARVLRDVAADTPVPEDDVVLQATRRWVGPLAARADRDPVALSGLVVAIESLARWGETGRAWSTLLAKDRLPRREVSLGLDLGRFSARDYAAVADYMAPLMQLADAAAPQAGGFRWKPHGKGVLFVAERELDAPYDAFVARVDLSDAIRLMNDYIGGTAVVVARDRQGRVLRQAERNVYLPQPNYLAFSGGDVIDVCKLEVMRYGPDESTICWRTVRSPNGSAVHDDGAVTFRRVRPGRTLVRVHGLQEFVLPPFWQTVDLTRYPAVHDALTDDAYRRFFSATLDNFEARYEGREVSTGRPARRDPEPPTSRLSRTLRLAAEALSGDDEAPSVLRRSRPPVEVDEDGFHHVAGDAAHSGPRVTLGRSSAALSSLVADLRVVLDRDLSRGAGR